MAKITARDRGHGILGSWPKLEFTCEERRLINKAVLRMSVAFAMSTIFVVMIHRLFE
jgi:hypothetical protein